jgi:quinoprotein glucose dehydrogenase
MRHPLLLAAALAMACLAGSCAPTQKETAEIEAPVSGDWPMYRGDLAGTGYSPLAEITAENVPQLARSWTYSLLTEVTDADGNPNEPRSAFSQATPIVVDGVMYLPTADAVVALDPTTGDEIWRHSLEQGRPSRRGVAYWPGNQEATPRIVFTSGARLVALDATTGGPVPDFGDAGEVDLAVPYNSVPLVYENIVVVGANTPRGARGGVGNARAYDAGSGAKLWEFSSVPQPGEVGHETWEGESWRDRLGVNAWPFYFTVDAERGHVYLPLAAPVAFAYGGDRLGANLFANSVVAVDIRTGEYAWHFQTIHHDLWDHDPPAPPVLFDIEQDGSTTPALGLTTKSGYLYILHRDTGEPLFGVEERPMPASDVPGEQAFATQPIPTTPPALARVAYDPADLVSADDTSPEHAAACAELVEGLGELHNEGPFTPWVYRPAGVAGPVTLLFPGLAGGHNWGGVAFDPRSATLFAYSSDVGTLGWVEDADDDSPVPYVLGLPRPASFAVELHGQQWPCQKPPWGRLSAVQASTGELAWQQPIGITEGLPPQKQRTGRPGRASVIVTASGLLFIASTDDNRLRALAAATGEELWAADLGQHGNANPLSYTGSDGRQYVAVVATDQVLAYRLP